MFYIYVFFFFKQKTAYEMRISDWSSDVCSSDLRLRTRREYGLHVWNEELDRAEGDEIGKSGVEQDRQIGTGELKRPAGRLRDRYAAERARHAAHAGDRGDGAAWIEIADHREDVGREGLMPRGAEADQRDRDEIGRAHV